MNDLMPKSFTTILLIGEGGLVKELGVRLLQEEHSVWALVPTEGLSPSYARLGINPLVADLSEPFLAKMAVANADVVYHLAGRRQHGVPTPEPADLKALQTILSVIPRGRIKRYIYESSLAVYDGAVPPSEAKGEVVSVSAANHSPKVMDETVFCRPKSATGRIHLDAEREILARFSEEGFPGILLRAGALYQALPGVIDQIRRGVYSIPSDLPPILHRIYLEDYLDILVAALEKGRPGQTYNVVDQEPHTPVQYFSQMASLLGAAPPLSSLAPPSETPVRYQNQKLIREFNRPLRFPTFREGLRHGIEKAGI